MTIVISLAEALAERVEAQRCSLCGLAVQTDVALPWLRPFADNERDYPEMEAPRGLSLGARPSWRRSITGAVAGCERRLEIEARQDGLHMQIEAVGELFVSADGSHIRLVKRALQADRDSVVECVLGAPLVLCLALRGRWLMHASAVNVHGRVVAFAGASGAGKSTLAAHLSGESGLARVADDLLAYGLEGGLPVTGGEFPQLKLSADQQPMTPPQPLAAVMLLVPASGARRVSLRHLQGRDKLLGFLAHAVAARAFPPVVLAQHLNIAAQAVEFMDVIEVRYPRTREALTTLALHVHAAYGAPCEQA